MKINLTIHVRANFSLDTFKILNIFFNVDTKQRPF